MNVHGSAILKEEWNSIYYIQAIMYVHLLHACQVLQLTQAEVSRNPLLLRGSSEEKQIHTHKQYCNGTSLICC